MSSGNVFRNVQYYNTVQPPQENRYIYVKNELKENDSKYIGGVSQNRILNDHFKTNKVFVNPNFSKRINNQSNMCKTKQIHINPRSKFANVSMFCDTIYTTCQTSQDNRTLSVPVKSTKIHINPKAKSVQIPLNSQPSVHTVHINPHFKQHKSIASFMPSAEKPRAQKLNRQDSSDSLNKPVILTKNKLVRIPITAANKNMKRRNSVKSKFKIVKSTYKMPFNKTSKSNDCNKSRFKIDHRRRRSLSVIEKKHKKYVYVNKFVNICVSDLVKMAVIKQNPTASDSKNLSMIKIDGVMYRKSRNTLRRISVTNRAQKKITCISPVKRHEFTKKPIVLKEAKTGSSTILKKKFKIVRKQTAKAESMKIFQKKLTKCNIPCPFYRKYGICKGHNVGKCFLKHNPDQIALCTKFLQGACINESCLLSHKISPEKMPTCKFYLEGSCSKENCSYLHVKLSPNADVCRDFLEGFCKKAAECDKRHQYLCPDFEKYGKCSKQRCQYPHGKMVRRYLIHKNKFAKNYSAQKTVKNEDLKERHRYYAEINAKEENVQVTADTKLNIDPNNMCSTKNCNENFVEPQPRSKLGSLPSFIAFNE